MILEFLKALQKILGIGIYHISSVSCEDIADRDVPGIVMVVLPPPPPPLSPFLLMC